MSSWATAPCTLSTRTSASASGGPAGRSRTAKSRQSSRVGRRRCAKGVLTMKRAAWCWFAGGLLLCGCAGSEVSSSGTVTLDGKPLADGDIRFIPIEGTSGPDAGAEIKDGKYNAFQTGLAGGKYRVSIAGHKESGYTEI